MTEETKEVTKIFRRRPEDQPTDDRLKLESAEAARVLTEVWDGEVEVTVIMCRKDSNMYWWSTTLRIRDKLVDSLAAVSRASAIMGPIKRGLKMLR